MIFTQTRLAGAYVIDVERRGDARGFFARTVAEDEFAAHGLNARFVQQSVSWNPLLGTLRGLHYQAGPYEEDKLVRVTRGAIFDVIVDLRQGSPTYGNWFGVELGADNHRQLYIPKGFAHGFQTILPDAEISYQMTVPFHPDAARGVRWDDPTLAIGWPSPQGVIVSDRDKNQPLLADISA